MGDDIDAEEQCVLQFFMFNSHVHNGLPLHYNAFFACIAVKGGFYVC
jgi:hypothetical protein